MTDIVTLSPECEYCDAPAEFQCEGCGAYLCADHVDDGVCFPCGERRGRRHRGHRRKPAQAGSARMNARSLGQYGCMYCGAAHAFRCRDCEDVVCAECLDNGRLCPGCRPLTRGVLRDMGIADKSSGRPDDAPARRPGGLRWRAKILADRRRFRPGGLALVRRMWVVAGRFPSSVEALREGTRLAGVLRAPSLRVVEDAPEVTRPGRPGWPNYLFVFRPWPILEGNVDRAWDVCRRSDGARLAPSAATLEWNHRRQEWELRCHVPGALGRRQVWHWPGGPDSVPGASAPRGRVPRSASGRSP